MSYFNLSSPSQTRDESERLRLRLLVLESKRIPYFVDARARIFVPPVALGTAAREVAEFEAEREVPRQPAPGYDNGIWVLFILSVLFLFDALQSGGLRGFIGDLFNAVFPGLPVDHASWVRAWGLDYFKVVWDGEWWRLFTALLLHADAAHLWGNFVFGALFLLPLCRRVGLARGFLLCLAGGVLGNAAKLLAQGPGSVSIGFSTAVFAAMGALCGLTVMAAFASALSFPRPGALRKGLFPPIAAGIAFLAFLGGSGEERVDFPAHVCGIGAGLLLGLLYGLLFRRRA